MPDIHAEQYFTEEEKQSRIDLYLKEVAPHIDKAKEACRKHGFNIQCFTQVWQNRTEDEEAVSLDTAISSTGYFNPDEVTNEFLGANLLMREKSMPISLIGLTLASNPEMLRLSFDTKERRQKKEMVERQKREAATAESEGGDQD